MIRKLYRIEADKKCKILSCLYAWFPGVNYHKQLVPAADSPLWASIYLTDHESERLKERKYLTILVESELEYNRRLTGVD